eukprot:3944145-Amphidinium_carterae.1
MRHAWHCSGGRHGAPANGSEHPREKDSGVAELSERRDGTTITAGRTTNQLLHVKWIVAALT